MGANSKIEWTDHTFNPWIGCAKVSAGCKNCYAEALMDKRLGRATWGVEGSRVKTAPANWKAPLKWNADAAATGQRARVFCASLADVFEDRPELALWRVDLLKLIEQTQQLDWLLLTKRPENVVRMIEEAQSAAGAEPHARGWLTRFSNVWIGTTVENQAAADSRIPELLKVPAATRFLSCEPLLGPVDLRLFDVDYPNYKSDELPGEPVAYPSRAGQGIHWVIAGGESGSEARPALSAWFCSLRDQCLEASVPFHFKQYGEWMDQEQMTLEQYQIVAELDPDALGGVGRFKKPSLLLGGELLYRIGKHHAGRRLDGVEWNQFPEEGD